MGEQDKKSSPSIRQLGGVFVDECSMHGLGHIFQRPFYRGMIWFAAVGVCTSYLFYLLHTEWVNYHRYPFLTISSVKSVSSIKFPAVTFCNLSPYNKSKVASDPRDEVYHMAISRLNNLSEEINWMDPYYQKNGYFAPRTFNDVANETLEVNSVVKYVMFDGVSVNINQDLNKRISTNGMCYTWNSNGSATTSSTGSSFNFIALLSVNNDQNYQNTDCSNGFKVAVHDPLEDPAVENNGFLVPPGRIALAKLSKTRYSYLGNPFKAFGDTSCDDINSPDFQNPVHPEPYSINACKRRCESDLMFQRCGCIALGTNGDHPICSLYQYYQCNFNTSDQNTRRPDTFSSCDCPQPCRQTTYDAQMSYALYPTEDTATFLNKKLGLSKEYFSENFVELHIHFDHLQVRSVQQVPLYTSYQDILSSIGGQMGLLLGASLLSLLEIVEFILNCAIFLLRKFYYKAHNNKVNKEKISEDEKVKK
ncbi:acid-sensing ion channel 3-like [Saccostrea echinata]|uniref:acid-sensing ion channel 3-like n=1 Tax=Saccostrea echinata TaxID=191078 RepID=UPI002A819B2B|nr:acid-sensing ion channel 3-like [Saccostrea echinata]